ncbi:MAG: FAD:protein FMN transferase [Ruminococcus sp.]|nr:FAD:protein FMN transferase [Ruminococcus sp.]
MKSKTIIIAVCFALALLLTGGIMLLVGRRESNNKKQAYKTDFISMDTACTVTLYGDPDMSGIRSLVERLDRELDRYNEESEFYKFNSGSGASLSGSSLEVYTQSKELYEKYGYVDITCGGLISLWGITGDDPKVPDDDAIKQELDKVGFDKIEQNGTRINAPLGTKLDAGAVAKGYALDRLKALLYEQKADCAVVSLGSSTILYGQKPDGTPFNVGIKDPFSPDKLFATFETNEAFVSTSGGYERFFEADGKRYIHILDLTTGYPSESDLASVTVITDSGIKSDFLSTAIFLAGSEDLHKYLDDDSIKVIAIDNSGKMYNSESLDGKITLK